MIRTSKTHKRAVFKKDLINNLTSNMKAKFLAGLSVVSATLVLFTSCSGAEQYSKEDLPEPTNPKAYTLDDESSVTSQSELDKLIDHDYDDYESYDENSYKQEDFTIYNSYDELVNGLNAILEGKDFPEDVNTMYRSILDKLYENYDSWKIIIPDLPEKHEYLSEIINNISKIKSITIYDKDSKEAKEIEKLYGATTALSNGSNITFIYNPNVDDSNDLSILCHESIHASKQRNIMNNVDYFDSDYYLKNIFIEGGADFNTLFLTEYKNDRLPGKHIYNNNGTMISYLSNERISFRI